MAYALYIDSFIPAFCGEELTVPYKLGAGTSESEIKGFKLKVKSCNTEKLMGIIESKSNKFDIRDLDIKLTRREFYKVQLTYKNQNDEWADYSTIGIVKYTSAPTIEIRNPSTKTEIGNTALTSYLGYYKSSDVDEKIYTYQFKITNLKGTKTYHDSGIQFQNNDLIEYSNSGASFSVYNSYTPSVELTVGTTYKIVYTVTTVNGLVKVYSKSINRVKGTELTKETITVENCLEEGSVLIKTKGLGTNKYIISRTIGTETDTHKTWTFIGSFTNQEGYIQHFKDFTVEDGKTYIYSIQQAYSNGKRSERKLSTEIIPTFEYIFLSDNDRQLKIKFDPKVSSFKTTLMESKTDTIGGKYPFFFRNGQVGYKEFPINGLISYLQDDERLFMTKTKLGIDNDNKPSTTNLIDYNISREKEFKIAVLDWLNNGKPKLFRSPTEGNYIVRLMNISLSPNDTLGRMLHSFSATAYEMATCSYTNRKNYQTQLIIKGKQEEEAKVFAVRDMGLARAVATDSEPGAANTETEQTNIDAFTKFATTIGLEKINSLFDETKGELFGYEINSLMFTNCPPGTKVSFISPQIDTPEIVIGSTGNYSLENVVITNINIAVPKDSNGDAIMCSYMANPTEELPLAIEENDNPLVIKYELITLNQGKYENLNNIKFYENGKWTTLDTISQEKLYEQGTIEQNIFYRIIMRNNSEEEKTFNYNDNTIGEIEIAGYKEFKFNQGSFPLSIEIPANCSIDVYRKVLSYTEGVSTSCF